MTEQERNLQWVKLLAVLAASALVVALWLLYYGNELPFYEMRRQPTDPTGYAPPPRPSAVAAASVPRMAGVAPGRPQLSPPLPDPADGSIPAQAAALRSPLAGVPDAGRQGKAVYDVNCAQCHGKTGRGDGAVGVSYIPAPTDLTAAPVQRLSDGALFYSITNGILSTPVPTAARYLPRDWHAYRSLLTTQERWATVAYVRTLEAKRAAH